MAELDIENERWRRLGRICKNCSSGTGGGHWPFCLEVCIHYRVEGEDEEVDG